VVTTSGNIGDSLTVKPRCFGQLHHADVQECRVCPHSRDCMDLCRNLTQQEPPKVPGPTEETLRFERSISRFRDNTQASLAIRLLAQDWYTREALKTEVASQLGKKCLGTGAEAVLNQLVRDKLVDTKVTKGRKSYRLKQEVGT